MSWGSHVERALADHQDELDECFVTVTTRQGREILARGDEFEVGDGFPAVWKLGRRFVPEPEITMAEVSVP